MDKKLKIKKDDIKKWIALTREVEDLLREIQEYCPEAHLIVVGDFRLAILDNKDFERNSGKDW